MNAIIQRYSIKPADRIVVPKSNLRFVQHHAIYLGQDDYGQDWIAENKIGYGVRLITAESFFRDTISITRIERFAGTNYDRKASVQKALRELGKPYSLINYNCESFANYVQNGFRESNQVKWGFGLSLLALLIIGVASNK